MPGLNNSTADRWPTCLPNSPLAPFSYVINGVLTPIFVFFGLVGGLCTLRSLIRKTLSTRLAKYFVVLCIWDIALLLSTFGFYGYVSMTLGSKPWNGPYVFCYMVFYPLAHITMTGSMWMVLAISVERYKAVASPFKHGGLRDKVSVEIICTAVAVGALLVNAPTIFELTYTYCERGLDLSHQISTSPLRFNRWYLFGYRILCYMIVISPTPFAIILILTLKTLFYRKKAADLQQWYLVNAGENKKTGGLLASRTTAILTAMIVKFLICYTTPTAVNISEFIRTQIAFSEDFSYVVDVSNFLVVVHSATNWLIFSFWTRQRSERNRTLVRRCDNFSKQFCRRLRNCWLSVIPEQFGCNLLLSLLANNTLLIQFPVRKDSKSVPADLGPLPRWLSTDCKDFAAKLSEEDPKSYRLALDHGCEAGKFIDSVIKQLGKIEEQTVAERIRRVGAAHCEHAVNMQIADWLIIKHTFVEQCQEASDGSMEPEVELLANRFVSFLIRELKCGFLCQAVNDGSV